MIGSCCKTMIIRYSQPTKGMVTGFAELYLLPKLIQYPKNRLTVDSSFNSPAAPQSHCLLCCGHCWPSGNLGESIPTTGQFLHRWWSSALVELSLTLKGKSNNPSFNSFFLSISVSDGFMQFQLLSHFLLNKKAFQACWSTLSCAGAMLCVTRMHVLHWALVPSAKSWAFIHLTLRRCSLADPTHRTAKRGQHCTLTCREKASTLCLEVILLSWEELQKKTQCRRALRLPC